MWVCGADHNVAGGVVEEVEQDFVWRFRVLRGV
jgi:hypothetical protein